MGAGDWDGTGGGELPRSVTALEESRAWWSLDLESGSFDHLQDDRVPPLLGYDPAHFDREETFLDLVHPDDRSRVLAAMDDHLEGEATNYEARYRVRAPDDTYHWVEAVGRVTAWDEDGEPQRVEGILTHVDERVRHQRKLEQLRERTHVLLGTRTREEAAEVAVETVSEVIGAPLSGVHFVDESGERLDPAALADRVTDLFDDPPAYERDAPPGSRAGVVWKVFETGEPLFMANSSEHEGLDESSPAKCVQIRALGDHGVFVVSSDEPNAFSATDLTLVDILASALTTALDRAEREERLRDRERRLERLHEATRDLVRAETPQEVAEHVAGAARDVVGFDLAMVRFYEEEEGGLVPVAGTEQVAETLPDRPVWGPENPGLNWEAYRTGEPRVHNDLAENDAAKDAELGVRSLIVLPLGEYGTLSAADFAPAAFDETDLFLGRILATSAEAALEAVERAAELRDRRDDLERQNERLEEFAGVVSHDLRNPLSVVRGSLDLALSTGERDHVRRAATAADRMDELVADLLALSRAGDSVDDPSDVALAPLFSSCVESVPGRIETSVETDAVVRADRNRLRQLFENLLGNAVEHAAGEDGTVRVTLGCLEDGDGFFVADDGPGIPEGDRERVFEKGVSTSEAGTGFGLHIVQTIAEAHGWSVSVTEGVDGGARFEVRGVELVDGD